MDHFSRDWDQFEEIIDVGNIGPLDVHDNLPIVLCGAAPDPGRLQHSLGHSLLELSSVVFRTSMRWRKSMTFSE